VYKKESLYNLYTRHNKISFIKFRKFIEYFFIIFLNATYEDILILRKSKFILKIIISNMFGIILNFVVHFITDIMSFIL
jgi:hypothetical protein